MDILFPFEYVQHDSRIVIYGAGMVGQIYLRQVRRTHYGEVVCLSDKHYQHYQGMDVKVCAPDELRELDFDIIVIAMMSPAIREEAAAWLSQEFGLNPSRIVTAMGEPVSTEVFSTDDIPAAEEELTFSCFSNAVTSAVYLRGGLGDCIVMKRYLMDYLGWDDDIVADIYVRPNQYNFVRILLSDVPQVHRVISSPIQYNQLRERYRVAFTFHFDCNLDFWDDQWLTKHKIHLAQKFRYIDEIKRFVGNVYGIGYLVHRARCEMEGHNFFNAYNRYGFNVQSRFTTIPLLPEYAQRYQQLKLTEGNYIVLNYGWGRDGGWGKPMAKVWLWRHYFGLIRLLREKLPDFALVQIGLKQTQTMPGIDYCFLGEGIELIKYILKGAALHIDCEGGMVHLATQLGTKCIVIFGPTKMSYYAYPENINLQAGACHDCYTYVSDGLSCYRRLQEPECMAAVTPEMVAEAAVCYLAEKRSVRQ